MFIMIIGRYFQFIFLIVFTRNCIGETETDNSPADELDYTDEDNEDYLEEGPVYEESMPKPTRSSVPFESGYVGTNLLDGRALRRKCFSPEDESRLAARVEFEVCFFFYK